MKYKFNECIDLCGKSVDSYKGKKQYISTSAVNCNIIDESQIELFNYDEKPSRANLQTIEGSIIFAKMQNTKKTLIIDKKLSDNIYSTGFFAVKPKSNLLTINCLFYLLNSEYFLRLKDKNCSGATQKAITNEGLEKIEINIPKIEEQEILIKKLNILENSIKLYQSQLKKFDLLIKSRFIEMFGAKNIEKKMLEDISIVKGEYGASSAAIPKVENRPRYVRITDINDDGTLNNDYTCSDNIDDDITYKLEIGDFLFARMGATVGKTYVCKENNQIFAGYLIRYKLNKNIINPIFLYWYTKSDEYKNWVITNQSGAAQPGINAKKYNSLLIPCADIDKQNEFATFVEECDKLKFVVQKALDKTKMLMDSLMQEYFG